MDQTNLELTRHLKDVLLTADVVVALLRLALVEILLKPSKTPQFSSPCPA